MKRENGPISVDSLVLRYTQTKIKLLDTTRIDVENVNKLFFNEFFNEETYITFKKTGDFEYEVIYSQ